MKFMTVMLNVWMSLRSRREDFHLSHAWRSERGNAMVEFALLIGLLMLITMGIFDLSRTFYAYAAMTNAARDGTRFAIAHYASGTCVADTRQRVLERLIGLDTAPAVMTITVSCASPRANVKIDYKFRAASGMIATFLDAAGELTIHAESSMLLGY